MCRKKDASNTKYTEDLLSSIRKSLFVLDLDGNILHLNDFAEEMIGEPGEKILGTNFFTIFPEWATPERKKSFHNVMKSREIFEQELFQSDSKTWYFLSAFPGETGLLVHLSETTSNKRIQDRLHANQKLLVETGKLARVGGWEVDLITGTVVMSKVTREIHEVDDDFVPTMEKALSFYPNCKEELQAQIQKTIDGHGPYSLELPFVTAKGNHLWTLFNGRGEFVNGKCVRLVGAFQDITQLKLAQEAKIQSENRFRMAISMAPYPAIIHNEDGRIVFVNRQWVALTGYTREDIPTIRDWTDRAHGEASAKIAAEISTFFNTTGEVDIGASDVHCKNGQVRKWEFASIQLEGTESGQRQLLSMANDVTEKLELENRLIQAHKMESIGQLAGGIAHDFNNMLMGIMNYAEMTLPLLEKEHVAKGYIQEVVSIAERSAGITRQLLAFARKQTIQPTRIPVNETVEGTLKMLSSLIGETIDVIWEPGENLWPARMDPSQFDQILTNLAVNARDAIDGVGNLHIETSNQEITQSFCSRHPEAIPGEFILLKVSDDGCGIEADRLEKIFEPFHTSKENGEGTGLGLATVHGIASQNGGFVLVESQFGKGTSFFVYIPKDQDDFTEKDKAKKGGGAGLKEGGATETILMAEDEPMILKTLEMFLKLEGYNIIASTDPLQLLEKAEQLEGDAHLLITDVVMPKMNGKKLSLKIKEIYPDIPILFMSGYTDNIIEKEGVLQSETSFLAKPFTTKRLGEKVREMLGKKA